MAYTVTFWGTRGSIPTPGAHTARYGGNTPCVAVEGTGGHKGGGQLVILDAGTGIRALGRELVERQNGAVQAEILLSHAHWDHIQGLPHFKPFFAPGNAVRIWGSRQGTTSLEAILRQQMDPAVFPVPLDALSAKLTVQQVEPGEFAVGTFRVQAMRLRHPGTTLGYRLTPAAGGPSMAYVTDNELGPGGHYETAASWRKDFVAFLGGVELLIHDAMYTPEELEEHRGWGHSTFEEAVALAGDAGVKRLVLFHHEPEHGDEAIDALVAAARRRARAKGLPAEVAAAQAGMTLPLRAKPRRVGEGDAGNRRENREARRRALRHRRHVHRLLRRLPAGRAAGQCGDERDRQGRVGPHAAGPLVRHHPHGGRSADEGRQPAAAPSTSLGPADEPPDPDGGPDVLLEAALVPGPRPEGHAA